MKMRRTGHQGTGSTGRQRGRAGPRQTAQRLPRMEATRRDASAGRRGKHRGRKSRTLTKRLPSKAVPGFGSRSRPI